MNEIKQGFFRRSYVGIFVVDQKTVLNAKE